MNKNAEQHLAKAKDYIARGDEFYRKAKPEIEAAKREGAPVQDICRYLQKSERWVYDVLAWDGKGTLYGKDTERRQIDMAKQVLRESTSEQTEELVASLPKETVAKVADAVYRTQVDTLQKTSEDPASKLTEDDYQDAKARFEEIHSSSTLEMDELFTALSRVRVKGVEKIVANASVKQRREWGERLPEEIALLQLALDLCRTQKLEAVR